MDDGYIGALREVFDYLGGDLMVFRNLLNGSVVLLICYNRHLHLARRRLNTRTRVHSAQGSIRPVQSLNL